MTQVDVVFRYAAAPSEPATLAIARLREIYGVRKVEFRETEKTVRVEFDSTRLSESNIHQFLRRAGLDVTEKVALFKPPVPIETAPVSGPALTALDLPHARIPVILAKLPQSNVRP